MTTPPPGAQLSPDGFHWWDGAQWQPVAQGADAGAQGGAQAADAGQGQQQPQQPPQVILAGEASFDPAFPKTGEPIVYTWGEVNVGGPTPDTYHARVEFKDPDGNLLNGDAMLVECQKLETNGQASRTTSLPAPTRAAIGYSIELFVDVDHNASPTTANYAYHNVDVSDPT